jgi:HSP20 family protein
MSTLVRWDPIRDVAALHTELSRLMNGLPDGNGRAQAQSWVPTLDVWETEDSVFYAFDLPGLTGDQISIEIEEGALTVSANRKREMRSAAERFQRFERHHGMFSRTVGLPQGVSEDSIEASYTNGVLEIRAPKPEQPKPKRVPIKATNGSQATIEAKAANEK